MDLNFQTIIKDLESSDEFRHLAGKLAKLRRKVGPIYAGLMSEHEDSFICHGDLWANNVMFDGEDDCRIVDWQCAAAGNPLIDFGNIAFISMSWNETIGHLQTFIDTYFNELAEICKRLDSERYLPWKSIEEFKDELMRKGTLVTFMWCITSYQQTEKNPNMKEREFKLLETVIEYNPHLF